MPKGNINNLRTLSSEEAREQGRKGGLASAAARAKKKAMQEEMQTALEVLLKDKKGEEITTQYAVCLAQIKKALSGDTRAAEFVRDTSGQKPVDKVIVADVDKSVIDEVEGMVNSDA